MKKRILALALAGTTAFSVFGSAISANAAWWDDLPSSHTVAGKNDSYKHYEPVAAKIEAEYANTGEKYYKDTNLDDAKWTQYNTEDDIEAYILKSGSVKESYSSVKLTQLYYGDFWIDATTGKLAVFGTDGITYKNPEKTDSHVTDVMGNLGITEKKNGQYQVSYSGSTAETVNELSDAFAMAIKQYNDKSASPATEKYVSFNKDGNGSYVTKDSVADLKSYDEYFAKIKTKSNATGSIDIYEGEIKSSDTWTFDGSTSADTTIYPWTVETIYEKNPDGTGSIKVDEAVETPTVYLFDFLPANNLKTISSDLAAAYNDGDTVSAAGYITGGAVTETWTAETGDGTSYGIRAEVVDQYEEFLSELVLLQRYGNSYISETDFKNEYKDRFVSGYLYNPYTGLASNKYEWTTDLYNLNDLLDDIYESSLATKDPTEPYEYLKMNTSELMYLMQQYDKYIGDYVEKEEVSNDDWGDLLVSILENVSEDDFTSTAAYKSFARTAEDAIDAYTYATTSSLVKAAEREMYNVIVGSYSKTSSVTDAKADLDATVGSLFFNAKTTPDEYLTDGIDTGNAALTNYAYIGAVTTNKVITYKDEITLTNKSWTTTGYYSMYPADDYKQNNNDAAQFPGNDVRGSKTGKNYNTSYGVDATDEYEWFLNVYELAKAAGSSNVSGVVSAVNEALASAVADLTVTVTAAPSANLALEEEIANAEETLDFYVTGNGVNKEDFSETYYNAYTKALEIAEGAEGATQVAHARYMVGIAAGALTYQGAQATVTKNDMKTVETAIENGKTALEAIKNSADYNAAQVTALNKAIAQAEDIVAIYNGKHSNSTNYVNYAYNPYVGDKDGIVKSDITGAIDAIDAAINYSEIIMGWSQNDNDDWMYGTEEGYLNNGWNKIGSVWYYFNEDGTAKQSEWFKENGKWYWLNSNCGAAYGWAKVDGKWYYFNGDNSMRTGWVKVEGNWYYLASSGAMVTGWCEVDGKWYYFSKNENALGQMERNTTIDGYKLGDDGAWIK